MSDLHGPLDHEARRIDPTPDALESVLRRARKRHLTRRVGAGVFALLIAGGGFAVAVSAFSGPSRSDPAAGPRLAPTPGPTPTGDDPTPDPILVEIADATALPGAAEYAVVLLASEGRGRHHGGYDVVTVRQTEGSEATVLYCDAADDQEALRLQRLFFPDAEIRFKVPDEVGVRVVLGADFAEREELHLADLRAAQRFMWARTQGDLERARSFLSAEAAGRFDRHDGGLALEGYFGRSWTFSPTGIVRDGSMTVIVFEHRGPRGGAAYEKLTVGGAIFRGIPPIIEVERNL